MMKNDLSLYDACKNQMSTGDLLEWRTNGVAGEIIRTKTGRDVNHSGAVIILQSPFTGTIRRFTLEMLSDGIELNSLSYRLSNHDGQAYWYPLLPEFKAEIPTVEAKAFYLHDQGIRYDYKGLIMELITKVEISDELKRDELFCSAMMQYISGGSGVALVPGEIAEVMKRWDLNRRSLLP